MPFQPYAASPLSVSGVRVRHQREGGEEVIRLRAPVDSTASRLSFAVKERGEGGEEEWVLRGTGQFFLGRIIHRRLLHLPENCLAKTMEEANLFFIPYYRGKGGRERERGV